MSQRYYSNIYWHFTGSPQGIDWRKVRKPADILRDGKIRTPAEATEILKSIIKTKKLLATAIEVVSGDVATEKFCCVTDIPFKDLPEHASYYGPAAIGFKANTIHQHFLPVLYIPQQNLPVIEMLEEPIRPTFENAMFEKVGLEYVKESGHWGHAWDYAGKAAMGRWRQESERYLEQSKRQKSDPRIKEIRSGYLKNFLKITDFNTSSDETFYREREWRCLGDFCFAINDVAALIVEEEFLPPISTFVRDELKCAETISCLSWELVRKA
jgi:hypothetical protein